MSSEIFYAKAFLRVGDRFIPVVNHGSSNCYDFDSRGREIPERHWSVLSYPFRGRLAFTAAEIKQIAAAFEEANTENRGGTCKSRNRAFEVGEFGRWILAAENVIDKFLRNFDNKFTSDLYDALDALNDRLAQRMRENAFTETEITDAKLSLYDLITVASLVEKETARTSESATIASVIYNRLCSKLYPCLEIDATIQYALAERKEILSNADKGVLSPYNTYTNAGLPAGPIANPADIAQQICSLSRFSFVIWM